MVAVVSWLTSAASDSMRLYIWGTCSIMKRLLLLRALVETDRSLVFHDDQSNISTPETQLAYSRCLVISDSADSAMIGTGCECQTRMQ